MTITVLSGNTVGAHIRTYTGFESNYISEPNPTVVFNGTSLLVRGDAGNLNVALMRPSGISNIAASEIASSVTVGLFRIGSNTPSLDIDIHRQLRTWVETAATYNTFDGTNSWTSGGATSDGNDRSGTISAVLTVGNGSQFYTVTDSSGTLLADCQGMIDGTYAIEGHGLYSSLTTTAFRTFHSETGTDGNRPYYEITHAAGAGGTILPFMMNY